MAMISPGYRLFSIGFYKGKQQFLLLFASQSKAAVVIVDKDGH